MVWMMNLRGYKKMCTRNITINTTAVNGQAGIELDVLNEVEQKQYIQYILKTQISVFQTHLTQNTGI